MAAGGHANGRDDDEHQFDSIEAGAAEAVGEVAKEDLSDDGPEKSKEVDEQAGPFAAIRPIYKGNRSKNDVGREEVIAIEKSQGLLQVAQQQEGRGIRVG